MDKKIMMNDDPLGCGYGHLEEEKKSKCQICGKEVPEGKIRNCWGTMTCEECYHKNYEWLYYLYYE